MLEHNRNLSSIIGTIQDEGPPTSTSKGPTTRPRGVNDTAGSVETGTFVSTRPGRRRSAWRAFFYLLFAVFVLAATFIFIMGDRAGYLADLPYELGQYIPKLYTQAEDAITNLSERAGPVGEVELVVPVSVAEPDEIFSNQEIHERQSLIMKHLEELTASIAAIKTSNDQYRLNNRGELKEIQEDFQHKLDKITATVAGLQEGLAAQKENSIELAKSSSDINVVQPDSSEVPASGGWAVNVANAGHIETFDKLKKKLHEHGIQAETQEVIIGGMVRYRLRIPGFSTSDEARDYARNLDGGLGIKGPWVSKR
jgi:hypothetical protein